MLFGAGFLAPSMNALAGGGSFVALPALIAAEVPSVLVFFLRAYWFRAYWPRP